MENIQIKTPSELVEELGLRKKLWKQYRCVHLSISTAVRHGVNIKSLHPRRSFFNVVSLFGPAIFTAIMSRHGQRDQRLIAAADEAVTAHMVERNPGSSETYIWLKTQVELYTILCTEYRCVRTPTIALLSKLILCQRNSYFTVINLIGSDIFNFVEDHHRQRDGVIEAEAARIDDMIERIRYVAD